MKTWRWRDELYGINIELIRGTRMDEFLRLMQRRIDATYTDEDLEHAKASFACVVFWREKKQRDATLCFWFGRHVKPATVFGLSTIGHEAVHGAMAVFRDKKIPVTADSEEPFAYYQTYLFTEVLRRLRT